MKPSHSRWTVSCHVCSCETEAQEGEVVEWRDMKAEMVVTGAWRKGGRETSEWESGMEHLDRGEVRTVDSKGKKRCGREGREGGRVGST